MRVSLNWLADLVELPPEKELAERLTFAGLEVEKIERIGAGLDQVVVAKILSSAPHPKADRLSVTTVDVGTERLQIVCGAKNYQVGDKVPLARVGAVLPDGHRIEAAKLRGVDSFGMLCSQRELALSEDHEGLWILPANLELGQPVAQALALADTVFEINVTPNRADCLSHLGIAREVAALFGRKLKEKETPSPLKGEGAGVRVKLPAAPIIAAPDRCGRYLGQAVTAEAPLDQPSPPWMRARLMACGVRALGLAIDVTNYVLLELGQPLHAFDLAEIKHGISVRLARPGEKLRTLDGIDRALDADDLLICDGDRALALGGVIGGVESGVTAATRSLYLEAAWFEPSGIRRVAKRHGLHTEASHRFERGVDPELPRRALDRAVELLRLGAPDLAAAAPQIAEGQLPAKRRVAFRPERVKRLLGDDVPAAESAKLLASLGLAASPAGYEIPSHRFDLEGETDLIEEIARLRGYDSIPQTLPSRSLPPPPERKHQRALAAVRDCLAGSGFSEALNYSFIAGPPAVPFGQTGAVAIQNPLKAEQGLLRSSLLPGLAQNVRLNLAHLDQVAGAAPVVRLFETGRTFAWPDGESTEGPVRERTLLGIVACGSRAPVGWSSTREPFDFYDLKGVIEQLTEALGQRGPRFEAATSDFLHPRSRARLLVEGAQAGVLGELHPSVAQALGLPRGVFVAELDLGWLFARGGGHGFTGVPKFPAVLRDIALVVAEGTSAAAVETVLRSAGGSLLEGVVLFDVYRGAPLREGHKSLAYSLRLRAPDRTLTDEEAGRVHAAIVTAARDQLQAELRG